MVELPQNRISTSYGILSDELGAEGWKRCTQLVLLIENIPLQWTIAQLKGFLDGFGNVVKVEIFENSEVSNYPDIRKSILIHDRKTEWTRKSCI